jgi:hypothetical protein
LCNSSQPLKSKSLSLESVFMFTFMIISWTVLIKNFSSPNTLQYTCVYAPLFRCYTCSNPCVHALMGSILGLMISLSYDRFAWLHTISIALNMQRYGGKRRTCSIISSTTYFFFLVIVSPVIKQSILFIGSMICDVVFL